MEQNDLNKDERTAQENIQDTEPVFNEADNITAAKEPKKRTVSLGFSIFLILLAALISFQTTYVVLTAKYKLELNKAYNQANKLSVVFEAYELLKENYIYDIDDESLVDNMIRTFGAQDKYFFYYTAEEWAQEVNYSQGISYGIGVYVVDKGSSLVLAHIMADSPAYKAGLLSGDKIIAIDGKKYTELGYDNAVTAIAGDNGTIVNITVLRDEKELTLPVVRGEYNVETVLPEVFVTENGEKIGYVKVIEFQAATAVQFISAVDTLVNDGCDSLIFDMRDNLGGDLEAVLNMLDHLLPEGPIVHIFDSDRELIKTYESDENEINIPMAVLTNGNTASAAELFTSALRDYDKAVIIGEKTYGKGCGQNGHMLSNGGVIYTTSFFYDPPYGENYNGVGITPDITVTLPKEYENESLFFIPHDKDTQIVAAIEELTK